MKTLMKSTFFVGLVVQNPGYRGGFAPPDPPYALRGQIPKTAFGRTPPPLTSGRARGSISAKTRILRERRHEGSQEYLELSCG